MDLDDVDESGGHVRIKGPVGISRTARTRVVAVEPPSALRGSAEIGKKTRASIHWDIVPAPDGSRATLVATVDQASLLDAVLLMLGGRRWLQRIFERAVRSLGRLVGGV